MPLKKGQKLKEVTKDIMLRVRIDQETNDKLTATAQYFNVGKSEIVRRGIDNESDKIKK